MDKKLNAHRRPAEISNNVQPRTRPAVLDGRSMDTVDRPLPDGWRQHPQQLRPQQRYAAYGRPPHLDPVDPRYADYPAYYSDESYPQPPVTNVAVNNNGNFFRPWKEELALSLGKAIGNFFAWPVRLIGGIAEGVINAGLGILKLVLMAVIAPTLIYTGIEMYEASQAGESATEAAAEVGEQAVGLMGAVLGGIWDGVFGDDEEKPEAEPAVAE